MPFYVFILSLGIITYASISSPSPDIPDTTQISIAQTDKIGDDLQTPIPSIAVADSESDTNQRTFETKELSDQLDVALVEQKNREAQLHASLDRLNQALSELNLVLQQEDTVRHLYHAPMSVQ